MNDLSPDHHSWPNDPFELLNLERSADARTAKRAYFKLIRKYKPDRFPAEFQKIREAYEAVQNWLTWQDHQADDNDFAANKTAEASEGTGQVAKIADDSQALASKTDPLEQFFERLKSDGLKAALPQLENIDQSKGSNQIAKACLLKYFIGRFFPKSVGRSPTAPASEDVNLGYTKGDLKRIAWLLGALASPVTADAAMAQLRFEFDRNYRLANCQSVIDYLAKVDDFGDLAGLYKLRWEAIGHHQPWTVVQDIQSLQPRSLEFGGNSGDWLSLLAESVTYTVWRRDEKCIAHTETCWQEISTNNQTWTADAVELLILAAQQWSEMRGSVVGWMEVIPWARNTLPETSRAIWIPVAREISGDPVGSLNLLDYRFRVHSMAMTVFGEGLKYLAELQTDSETVDEMPWQETRELVACFLMELGTNDYAECRIPMMEFCILNQVSLMTFAAAANTFVVDEDHETWFDLLQRDAPLRCVVNACHAMNW